MKRLTPIALPDSTGLQREVALRVRRGLRLLDRVTPGWWKPINPKSLEISNRGMCVFAQATHSFEKGIIQIAQKAIEMKLRGVKTIDNRKNDFAWFKERPYEHLPKDIIIDVYHYGFEPDQVLYDLHPRRSRRGSWDALTDAWTTIVIARKKEDALFEQALGQQTLADLVVPVERNIAERAAKPRKTRRITLPAKPTRTRSPRPEFNLRTGKRKEA